MKKVLFTLMSVLACLLAWADNSVTVTYSGNTSTVTVDDNVAQYLTVTQSGAHVSIVQNSSVAQEITYTLTGTSTDGEFYMSGSYKATIELNGLTLTNSTPVYSGAAIHIQNGKRINVKVITGTTNTLTDAASGSQKGCLYVKGHAEFKQQGTLNVVGNKSHAIKAGEYITVKNATLNITSAVDDGISCNQYFLMESGTINISGTGDDGIQCDLDGETSTGMTINHEDEDSGNFYVSGGTITINSDAIAAKGIKCQGDAYISGTAVIDVTTTGKGEWDDTDQETNAACGLSADGDINISGGTLTLKATGSGGKGMKCDNVLNISGGDITVSTTGGLYYNNGNGTENTNYTANTDWVDNKYYSAAKGIKAGYKDESGDNTIYYGGINISGGTFYVTTTGCNAEGIESKNYLNVTGGETTIDAYDDGINAAQDLYITDGYLYSRASNNDGIDANGNVVIEGGLIYAIGAASPEVAIDANSEENKKFHFNGGILIAIGGLESGSTLAQTCYQASSVSSNTWYSMTYGGNVIAFLTPTVSSGGGPGGGGPGGGPGGGGPGGGSSSGLVISAPSTPTLKSGVTVSNGTPVFYGPKSYLDATVTGGSNVSLSQYSSGGGGNSGSYTVTASANPTAGGTVTGGGTYSAHSLCTLTATANAGYTFVNWTRNGSVASTDPTYSFYVTENTTCVANFEQGTYTVTATANPTEGGSITGAGTYSEGTNVTLKAIANEGYEFLNWTEDGTIVSTQATYTFVIETNRSLVANFEEIIVEGPRLTVVAYSPEAAPVNQETLLSLTFKNVGTEPTSELTTISLTCDDNRLTILDGNDEFDVLSANETITLSDAFSFVIAEGVEDGTSFQIDVEMVCGTETWTDEVSVTAHQAVLEYQNMVWDGSFTPGETITLTANFKNTGHYQATNAVATMTSLSDYISVSNSPIDVGNIAVGEEVSCEFNVTIADNCPASEVIAVTFMMTADGGLTAQGEETLQNSCMVYFNLSDSYGDGWNGAQLIVSFDNGTPSQNLTIASGSSAIYPLEINNGTHVTLTWSKGNYDNECSFTVSYEGDLIVYEMTTYSNPSAGVLFEFDCNCAAASAVFTVDVSVANSQQGTASGGGEFTYGQSCTVTAVPNTGYFFAGWTEDGEVVSSTNPYTFTVYDDHNLVANFAEGLELGQNEGNNAYLPSYSYYKQALTQQIYTADEIGTACTIISIAFYNEGAEKTRTYDFYLKHTSKSSFSSTTDWITVASSDLVYSGSVTMVANGWTTIVLSSPFEYDGISNLVLVADDNSGAYTNQPHMQCSVYNTSSNQAIYVYSDGTDYNPMSPPTSYSNYSEYNAVLSMKNHIILGIETVEPQAITQTIALTEGTNWFSTYVDITLDDLKASLVAAMPNNNATITIKSKAQNVKYQNGRWAGSLTTFDVTQMYKIVIPEACEISFEGVPIDPSAHTVTITPGVNWIAFPYNESMTVMDFFGSFPVNNDVVKSKSQNTRYHNGRWGGQLNTLIPGQGYIYNSAATENRTFNFPTSAK